MLSRITRPFKEMFGKIYCTHEQQCFAYHFVPKVALDLQSSKQTITLDQLTWLYFLFGVKANRSGCIRDHGATLKVGYFGYGRKFNPKQYNTIL